MAHELEMIDGKAAMVYTKSGGVPWHGLGYPVEDDMSPKEMMKTAKLDWTVEKVPAFATVNGKKIQLDTMALVRSSDNKILEEVSGNWNPLQNEEAFDFFREYTKAGNMTMETAGSLKGGQLVWAMAKIKDKFSIFKNKDVIESYLLLTNPFIYGMSISASLSMIRVVCANTLAASLSGSKGDKIVRVSHRKEFIAESVKETLGMAHEKMTQYKEAARFLASKKITPEQLTDYLRQVFPVITTKVEGSKKELSKNAKDTLAIFKTQPGAEFAPDSWWNAFNSVTYHLDHSAARNSDTRLTSAWYGAGKKLKVKALQLAVDSAK